MSGMTDAEKAIIARAYHAEEAVDETYDMALKKLQKNPIIIFAVALYEMIPLVILILFGIFFAEWRASEKDVLEQLTKLNQALACHDH